MRMGKPQIENSTENEWEASFAPVNPKKPNNGIICN
jgi:hypothetical protein